MNFEDQLREALQRETPSADFASRVLQRTERRPALWRNWRWAAAVAILIVLILSGINYQREQQRIAGERAARELMLALRVTGSKIRLVQQKLEHLNQASNRGNL
jgi:hypothetical protein